MILSVSGRLGGAERVLLDIVAVTRTRHPDWPVCVVSVEEGPLRDAVETLGADYDVMPLPRLLAETGEYGRHPAMTVLRLLAATPGLVAYAIGLRRRVRRWQPDVLHANGLKAHIVAAWVAGKSRVVWHVHDYLGSRAISAALFRRFAPKATVIVANSRSVAADVKTLLGSGDRIEVLYNAVDGQRFGPEGPTLDLDAAAGLPPAPAGTIRVGLVATYAKWKGHDVFLRALARLDRSLPLRAYVVGGPVYQTGASQWTPDALVTLVRTLGLDDRVGLVGFQPDTAPVYRALDVVVHASTSPEPFGLVIAEAMACGRAVIASAEGGAIEVAGDAALMHSPGDIADLAQCIGRLAGSAPLRRELGQRAGVSALARFSRERFSVELDRILDAAHHPEAVS
jgi:glycosyltransferase involved in cell wall biosynthesis